MSRKSEGEPLPQQGPQMSENDPLLTRVPLNLAAEFYPRGFPVRLTTNSPRVMAAAQEGWAGLQKRFDVTPLEVRCLVSSGERSFPPPPVVRAQRDLLIGVCDAANFWTCNLTSGIAAAWVSENTTADSGFLRYHVVEAMAYSLMESLHVISLHAACVSLGGHGMLLAGESGAGKSSLAYGCARRGWTYISDDASSLLRNGSERTVLGDPSLFRFRATAGALFPEFRGWRESRRPQGKPTIEVRTESLPAVRTACESRVDSIVFLNRRDGKKGEAEMLRCPRQKALGYLADSPWPKDLPGEPQRLAAVKRLLGANLYEMRYLDLDSAVDALERIVLGEHK